MSESGKLSADQLALGDMSPDGFRDAAHRVADLAADYLDRLEGYDVLPKIEPGATRAKLPAAPPASPQPLDAILADYRTIIEPYITHWQHPMFMAYFPSVATKRSSHRIDAHATRNETAVAASSHVRSPGTSASCFFKRS